MLPPNITHLVDPLLQQLLGEATKIGAVGVQRVVGRVTLGPHPVEEALDGLVHQSRLFSS